jgi:hypothetical protein
VAGQVGLAASFDGTTGAIFVPDNASLRLSTFTLAAWIFPTIIEGGNRIIEKGNSNSYYLDVNPGGRALVGFYDGAYHDLLGPVLAINTWHFIAGTYDGSVLRLYVDGVLVNSAALISRPAQTAEPLLIGWKFGGIVSDHFAGLIDELQIYNRALSASEVNTIQSTTLVGTWTGTWQSLSPIIAGGTLTLIITSENQYSTGLFSWTGTLTKTGPGRLNIANMPVTGEADLCLGQSICIANSFKFSGTPPGESAECQANFVAVEGSGGARVSPTRIEGGLYTSSPFCPLSFEGGNFTLQKQ